MKMVKCRACGAEIAKSAKRCPHCGAQQHILALSLCWIIVAITIFAIISIIRGGNSKPDSEQASVQTQTSNVVLCDNDNIKATYQRVYEEPSADGVFYLQVLVENKTSKTILVALENASVNGYSTMVMSGVPMTITPGEKSKNPFIISYKNLNVDKLSEVKSIKFSIHIYNNDNMSSIASTDQLSINVGS